jgi:6-phospho-beta-glucosidase
MIDVRCLDITVSTTTDCRSGLVDADAVLGSFRPGGFEARVIDEKLPLQYDVIGQETQGPGGFFMALRAVTAMRPILDDMAEVCPAARLFNYTNPVNIVAQAIADHTDVPVVSLCEGPIVFPQHITAWAGLDPDGLDVQSVGLNHGSWSVRALHDGEPLVPKLRAAYEARADDPTFTGLPRRLLWLTSVMETVPSGYFQYYYFEREILQELKAKATSRSEDILAAVPDYWEHYREQATHPDPRLDIARSRGGIHELELAIDCMDAVFNDRDELMPVNVPNCGSVPGFPDSMVVETVGRCSAAGVRPEPMPALPTQVSGLVESLGYYQQVAADAAWSGTHHDAMRALASHPLVRSLDVADRLYREMAHAHRDHLPPRLVPA